MASGILSSNSPYLTNTAGVFGVVALSTGAVGFVDRTIAWKLFTKSPPQDSEARRLADNFLLMWAGRDLYMGIVTIAAWYHDDKRALGYSLIAAGVICLQDGLLSIRQMGEGQWTHWGCAPVFAGAGARLLGWI